MSNNQLTVADVTVRQDDAGRFNLNDLHKAAGGERRHEPLNWRNTESYTALVDELSNTGIPVITKRGRYGGTFVVKELVYAYAMWISPKFHLMVIRAYDQLQAEGAALSDTAAGDLLTSEPFASADLLFTGNIHTVLTDSW
ncbi:KilA-N domain-containing protein [Halomonas sp. 18H]|nr:KilA-N domain-containing protein [Halomonas sp. 18H]MCW4147921.1 KilA-N domain-containing protein [Halomonas sp. 18H]